VYDPEKWAVVFKYTTIDIQGGDVTFKNHPSGAPVIWLASGDVSITGGTINLDGEAGGGTSSPPAFAEPGPGGFAGGIRGLNDFNILSSGGFGPGGAPEGVSGTTPGGGGYGSPGEEAGSGGGPEYGNRWIIPLIGGSGGGGTRYGSWKADSGAGGGAILIASSGTIYVAGSINADGGPGGQDYGSGGSGGAIRLIANSISGPGSLRARGGSGADGSGRGGDGRIRVEAFTINLLDGGNPPWTMDVDPGPVFPPAGAPVLRATLVADQSVPANPTAGVQTPDVAIEDPGEVTINVEAENIPEGTLVLVRIVPERGDVIEVYSDPLVDVGGGLLTASARVTFPPFRSEMQLKANWTPSP
jgi:hypothetical protein